MTETAERSTFVTVLAWVFIVLGSFATVIAVLQNALYYVVFPREQMQGLADAGPGAEHVPPFAKFMFANFELFLALFLLLAVVTVVTAVGLLTRKNWARLTFIGLMVFGILWNLGGFVLQQVFVPTMVPLSDAPPEIAQQFQAMQTGVQAAMLVFAFGFSALFGWIIWRLRSRRIVAEFRM